MIKPSFPQTSLQYSLRFVEVKLVLVFQQSGRLLSEIYLSDFPKLIRSFEACAQCAKAEGSYLAPVCLSLVGETEKRLGTVLSIQYGEA